MSNTKFPIAVAYRKHLKNMQVCWSKNCNETHEQNLILTFLNQCLEMICVCLTHLLMMLKCHMNCFKELANYAHRYPTHFAYSNLLCIVPNRFIPRIQRTITYSYIVYIVPVLNEPQHMCTSYTSYPNNVSRMQRTTAHSYFLDIIPNQFPKLNVKHHIRTSYTTDYYLVLNVKQHIRTLSPTNLYLHKNVPSIFVPITHRTQPIPTPYSTYHNIYTLIYNLCKSRLKISHIKHVSFLFSLSIIPHCML